MPWSAAHVTPRTACVSPKTLRSPLTYMICFRGSTCATLAFSALTAASSNFRRCSGQGVLVVIIRESRGLFWMPSKTTTRMGKKKAKKTSPTTASPIVAMSKICWRTLPILPKMFPGPPSRPSVQGIVIEIGPTFAWNQLPSGSVAVVTCSSSASSPKKRASTLSCSGKKSATRESEMLLVVFFPLQVLSLELLMARLSSSSSSSPWSALGLLWKRFKGSHGPSVGPREQLKVERMSGKAPSTVSTKLSASAICFAVFCIQVAPPETMGLTMYTLKDDMKASC
mmetsp:Transcript_94225/g.196649  ORF Transcript_94225/g.196649 Transcript_94225/m.196649 type:complete len:283 (+) Transcript_94225:1860-2708(+)